MELPKSWERGALQKNALETIARFDVAEAFNLLPSMDEPIAEKGVIAEDLRAFVAGTIFPLYWTSHKSAKSLSAIQNRARSIAVDGEYPFKGVLPILEDVADRDYGQGEAWWVEIVGAYTRGSKIRSADKDFASFLKSFWNVLTPPARTLAIELTVKQLMREPDSGEGTDKPLYQAVVMTSSGRYVLSNPSRTLILKLLPEIHEASPLLLNDLAQKEPLFSAAKEPGFTVRSVDESYVYAKSAAGAAQASGEIQAEQQLLSQVTQLASTNPAAALQVAVQLNRLRADGFSSISTALPDSAPASANATAESAAHQLKSADDKDLRLRLLALQVQAVQAGGGAAAESALNEGFSLGEDLFEEFIQSHPATPVDEVPPLVPLQELTRAGMRVSNWNTVDHVRRLGDASLRAWLLIAAAGAIDSTRR